MCLLGSPPLPPFFTSEASLIPPSPSAFTPPTARSHLVHSESTLASAPYVTCCSDPSQFPVPLQRWHGKPTPSNSPVAGLPRRPLPCHLDLSLSPAFGLFSQHHPLPNGTRQHGRNKESSLEGEDHRGVTKLASKTPHLCVWPGADWDTRAEVPDGFCS